MQMLFQWDMSKQDFTNLEAKFWKSAKAADKTRAFANKLFEGMAAIDRAILRLAIHEMSGSETPPKVVLNEAVELAKKYSSEEAGSFVNGVLDALHKSLQVK